MYVPEMYRFVMYYFQIPCTIDLQETIPGIGVGVCPRKLLKNGSMLIVHSQPIFCRLNFVYCLLIYSHNCGYFLPSKLRSPVFVLRENFHISCRGSYKVQEGSFHPLVVVGGGCRGLPGLPEIFFLKNGCKWCILSLFWADCLLIFSPKLWLIFATISSSLCI